MNNKIKNFMKAVFLKPWTSNILLVVCTFLATLYVPALKYSWNANHDYSTGRIYCDGDSIYSGKFYRAQYTTSRKGLYTTYHVVVRGNNNYYIKTGEYVCKTLEIQDYENIY